MFSQRNFGILLTVLLIVFPIDGKSAQQKKITSNSYEDSESVTRVPDSSWDSVARENITNFLAEYRRLRSKKSDTEMRILATVGLVSGALKVQDAMKENLHRMGADLIAKFEVSTPAENMEKLLLIEESIERDKSSIGVLNSMLAFARNAKTFDDFQRDMKHILEENEAVLAQIRQKRLSIDIDVTPSRKSAQTRKLMQRSRKSMNFEITEKLDAVKEMINDHIEEIHASVMDNARQTAEYLRTLQKSIESKSPSKHLSSKRKIKLNPTLAEVIKLWDQLKPENTSPDDPVSFEFGNSVEHRNPSQRIKLTIGEKDITPVPIGIDSKLDRFRRQGTRADKSSAFSGLKKQKGGFVIDIDYDAAAQDKQDDDDDNEIENEDAEDVDKADGAGGKGDDDDKKKEDDDEEFESGSQSSGEGGFAGFIANLSGGDEGSDIGAVVGALIQVVTNVLGPGGIDVPSVIGTATSLLSSLLGGDENFGKVLGNYAGLAVDGFSGGGGAINNGQFFGQFIGKLITSLSADPEDDDQPPQPGVFIQNVLDGIHKGASKKADGEGAPAQDSDSGNFMTQLFTTILAGLTNGIANASLGSSGGSSHKSAGVSGGSSHGSSDASLKKP